jgi:serine/threonine protein kinase
VAKSVPDAASTIPDEVATEPSAPVAYGARYVVEAEVGRGGMGRVFRARDLRLGREVALKILAGGTHDERQRLRFEQEARAAGALNHPNILAVHDVGEQRGEPYIVSELLVGESLRTVLRRGPLAQERALELGLQLASGLAAAHRKGIVHRDLKPENLFLTEAGHLKILDFGIAKLLPQAQPEQAGLRTDTGAVLGTPAYMSPEQVRGAPADARSDVFSAGAVLHELLTGSAPFERATTVETAYAVLHDAPAALPACALAHVIARCLEKDPAARYSDGAGLLGDLEAIARGVRTQAGKRLRRRVTGIAAIALLLTLVLAALVRERALHPGRVRIAVADFANETDDRDLTGLSGMLITSLEQSKRLSVLTRGTMY